MFGQRPSALLGVLSDDAALDIDLAAWAVLQSHENEANERAAENAERVAKGLDPLPPPSYGTQGHDMAEEFFGPAVPKSRREPQGVPKLVEIVVGGQRKRVPAPPPGAFYDKDGNLILPLGKGHRW